MFALVDPVQKTTCAPLGKNTLVELFEAKHVILAIAAIKEVAIAVVNMELNFDTVYEDYKLNF